MGDEQTSFRLLPSHVVAVLVIRCYCPQLPPPPSLNVSVFNLDTDHFPHTTPSDLSPAGHSLFDLSLSFSPLFLLCSVHCIAMNLDLTYKYSSPALLKSRQLQPTFLLALMGILLRAGIGAMLGHCGTTHGIVYSLLLVTQRISTAILALSPSTALPPPLSPSSASLPSPPSPPVETALRARCFRGGP